MTASKYFAIPEQAADVWNEICDGVHQQNYESGEHVGIAAQVSEPQGELGSSGSESPLSSVPSDVSSILSHDDAASAADASVTPSAQAQDHSDQKAALESLPSEDPTESPSKSPRKRTSLPSKSPYFPSTPKIKPKPRKPQSCLPFPPISSPTFGLIQETLAHNPFRLLLATIFLNRTKGVAAIPVFYALLDKYPSIEAFANAKQEDIVEQIRCLGFQNQRAKKCIGIVKAWLDPQTTPVKGKRYRKFDYPSKGDGRDIKKSDEPVSDEDKRKAFEVAHLPGVGAYAIDSWRIFCRDELRALATDWKGKSAIATVDSNSDSEFEPEWKRVQPQDKELRAYLTWMWLKEGLVWEPVTGEKTPASEKVMRKAEVGGVLLEAEEGGGWEVEVSPVKTIDAGEMPLELDGIDNCNEDRDGYGEEDLPIRKLEW